jgi:uncharacterized caspase-like protein
VTVKSRTAADAVAPRRHSLKVLASLGALSALHCRPALAQGVRRYALLIGNANYRAMPLKNPINDVRAVAAAIRAVDFDTTIRENLGFSDMIGVLRDFTARTQDAAVRLIYFAGHGLQIKGRNHLLPIDVEDLGGDNLPARTAPLDDILDRLGTLPRGANIIVLDACRSNPFSGTELSTPDGRRLRLRTQLRQGLAQVNPPYGTLIAFSTAPGGVAFDNPSESRGIYAKHFLAQMQQRGVLVEQFFKRVRAGVSEETARKQIPWESSNLIGDVCFSAGPRGCG